MAKLTNEEITEELKKYNGWALDPETGKLVAGFEFDDFEQALSFLNSVAEVATETKHHPDLLLHDYSYVTIFTFTEDEKAISHKDFELIAAIESALVAMAPELD